MRHEAHADGQRANRILGLFVTALIVLAVLSQSHRVSHRSDGTLLLGTAVILTTFYASKRIPEQARFIVVTSLFNLFGAASVFWPEFALPPSVLYYALAAFLAIRAPWRSGLPLFLASLGVWIGLDLSRGLDSLSLFGSEIFPCSAMYLGLHNARLRREGRDMRERHLSELRLAHAELEAAHAELKKTHAELQETTAQSVRYAALAERTRIAQDIHDGLGHHLTALIVQLQALELMLPGDPKRAAGQIREMVALARQSVSELRSSVRQWSEEGPRDGLHALRTLTAMTASRTGIRCTLVEPEDAGDWSPETGVLLYRVLQESLTNAVRHAGASEIQIVLEKTDAAVVMTVSDDGRLNPGDVLTPGFGLKAMIERCESAGGTFRYSPKDPHGLMVRVTLPTAKETSP